MSTEQPMGQPPLPPDVNSKKILCGIMGIVLGIIGACVGVFVINPNF